MYINIIFTYNLIESNYQLRSFFPHSSRVVVQVLHGILIEHDNPTLMISTDVTRFCNLLLY